MLSSPFLHVLRCELRIIDRPFRRTLLCFLHLQSTTLGISAESGRQIEQSSRYAKNRGGEELATVATAEKVTTWAKGAQRLFTAELHLVIRSFSEISRRRLSDTFRWDSKFLYNERIAATINQRTMHREPRQPPRAYYDT